MMIKEVSKFIEKTLLNFKNNDAILLKNQIYTINQSNFSSLQQFNQQDTVAYVDGGQSIILSTGNLCLSFIRIAAIVFQNNKKINSIKKEFFLVTRTLPKDNDIFYQSKIFGDILVDESHLTLSSNDTTIKTGTQRASIEKITNIARRFAELSLAKEVNADVTILDGTLEATYKHEEHYLQQLSKKTLSIAKTSTLFTQQGNNPTLLLNKLGPEGCWIYNINENTSFAKFHPNSKHVFRVEGNREALTSILSNCNDALFLGYPYGLILADQLARVTNKETSSLKMKFLFLQDNKDLLQSLSATNAHDILDNIQF